MGLVDKIFEHALKEYPQYNPVAHSRDPWVVTFDNILSDRERSGLIEAVGGKGGQYLQRSGTVGSKKVADKRGVMIWDSARTGIRTSYGAWSVTAGRSQDISNACC